MNKEELNEIQNNYFPMNLTLESLFSLIEEEEKKLDKLKLLFEGQQQMGLTVAAIPDIPVSEIGWSDISTPEGSKAFSSTARGQLMNFLSNIQGTDLADKLESLNKFYDMDEAVVSKLGLDKRSPSDRISSVLSYLVFYKTLTQILTNFNASSAGFSFESFLAVLLKGRQIPTGQNTIADLTDQSGLPISLKLYKEGSVEVGGSFKDLAKDLMKGDMQYIVCMKDIEAIDPTNPLSRNGKIDWYRFNFTLDNVFSILARSSKGKEGSRRNIILPTRFLQSVRRGDAVNVAEELPQGGKYPTAEEVEAEYIEMAKVEIAKVGVQDMLGSIDFKKLFQTLNYAKNDSLFSDSEPVRGKAKMGQRRVDAVIAQLFDDTKPMQRKPLVQALQRANEDIITKYSHTSAMLKRKKAISDEYFGGESDDVLIKRSLEAYNKLSREQKIMALQNCLGYVSNGHFSMTGNMTKNISAMAEPYRALPEGQSQVYIGTVRIGPEAIQKMLDQVISVVNENVFAIFDSLKVLTTNIQSYFAGGLQKDSEAVMAIHAADNIETKTQEVRKKS